MGSLRSRVSRTSRQVLWINLMVALAVAASLGLAWLGLPWLAHVVGLVAFLLPGLNVALMLEQLARRPERLVTLLLWAWVFSLTLTPAATHALGQAILGPESLLSILPAFGAWWAATLVGILILQLLRQGESGLGTVRWIGSTWREFWPVLVACLLILGANFILYPFIPEADSYTYLMILERAQLDPSALASDPRMLFLYLVELVRQLLAIDAYWILKSLLPLGVLTQVLVVYLVAQPLIRQRWLRAFVALGPLFFPIVLQETLISRPQSIAFFVLLPVLYLVGSGLEARRGLEQLYWLSALLVACVLSLQIHTLFTFLLPVVLLGLGAAAWPTIRRYPVEATIVLGLLAVLVSPWVSATRLIGDSARLLEILVHTLTHNQFSLWFLDHYRNVDGAELGWPGWSAGLYYGYNLGVFLPVLVAIGLVMRRWRGLARLWTPFYWPAWLALSFFVLIAEILPRFELAYLPDRAWLFIALIASLGVPVLVRVVTEAPRRSWLVGTLLVAGALSVGAGTGLTYAKQGWLSRAEAQAADFIRTETPADAIFLGQGGHHVLVRYLGHRTLIRPPAPVFLSDDLDSLDAHLAAKAAAAEPAPGIQAEQQRAAILAELDRLAAIYRSDAALTDQTRLAGELRALAARAEVRPVEAGADERQQIPIDAPVYVIYSRDKFSSLYGSRSWYRTSNFFGAKLEKFTTRYPVVYDHAGTTIWKVRD